MGCLSHIIDPRFLRPLITALSSGPLSELELHSAFNRDVPNRNLSKRSLGKLLEISQNAGLVTFANGTWRAILNNGINESVGKCLDVCISSNFIGDPLFRSRCAVHLDRGLLSSNSEYTSLADLACRSSLTPTEWTRLISGPTDLRQLTGFNSKHSEFDSLMIYRSLENPPYTDDVDVAPRIPLSSLPEMPTSIEQLLKCIHKARFCWQQSLNTFFDDVAIDDFPSFIIYAKDLLDYIFWGNSNSLKSTVSQDDILRLARTLQNFGLKAENLSAIWKELPLVYRHITRLSWGIRYLSNNLSHPCPPQADKHAFLRICNLPLPKQSAIFTSRSGWSLLRIIRPVRILQEALDNWKDRTKIETSVRDCISAFSSDVHEDKLSRREFADRIQRLHIITATDILDVFAYEMRPPILPKSNDATINSAGIIAAYSQFLDSTQGRAYAELRLALHAELDFKRRFNSHCLTSPQRYFGIWQSSILELVLRIEDTRKTNVPI